MVGFGTLALGMALRPGAVGRFGNRAYTIAAILRLSVVEDGRRYTWVEYVLVDGGAVAFLEYDEGVWRLMQPLQAAPPEPGAVRVALPGATLRLGAQAVAVEKRSLARVDRIEGEPPFAAAVGDEVEFIDGRAGSRRYSVELAADGSIEVFEGSELSEAEVKVAFGLLRPEALANAGARRTERIVLGVLCLVLAVVAFVLAVSSNGTVVASRAFALQAIGGEGVRVGPITLDTGRPVHRLEVFGEMTAASAWVAAVLETGEGREVVGVQGDFYQESGVDSDGSWSEATLTADTLFLARRPGPYYIHLYAERDTPGMSAITVGYRVFAGASNNWLFGLFGFAASCVGIALLVIKGTP